MSHPGKKAESSWWAIFRAPAHLLLSGHEYSNKDQARDAPKIRAKAIKEFIYLISAPFLAVAVYYLLQVTSKEIATPVLVVMAFATGLTADRIVVAIRNFAHSWIRDDDDEGTAPPNGDQASPPSNSSKVAEANAPDADSGKQETQKT